MVLIIHQLFLWTSLTGWLLQQLHNNIIYKVWTEYLHIIQKNFHLWRIKEWTVLVKSAFVIIKYLQVNNMSGVLHVSNS